MNKNTNGKIIFFFDNSAMQFQPWSLKQLTKECFVKISISKISKMKKKNNWLKYYRILACCTLERL